MSRLRSLVKLLLFLAMVAGSMIAFTLFVRPFGADIRARAAWLHRWTRRALWAMGVRLVVEGTPPTTGILTTNHLGYLDIFALSAAAPLVFVSRHDVQSWPIAGALTRMSGTIYIDRRRVSEVMRVGEAMVPIVAQGQPVALFLEGTSTGGDRVLPFRPSLLAPAVAHGWTMTPGWLSFRAPGADSAREVCYWGDATFFPHLLHFLGLRNVEAHVVFGAPLVAEGDRRDLAERLRHAVCALAEKSGASLTASPALPFASDQS